MRYRDARVGSELMDDGEERWLIENIKHGERDMESSDDVTEWIVDACADMGFHQELNFSAAKTLQITSNLCATMFKVRKCEHEHGESVCSLVEVKGTRLNSDYLELDARSFSGLVADALEWWDEHAISKESYEAVVDTAKQFEKACMKACDELEDVGKT